MQERKKTQRERLQAASTLLRELELSLRRGETIGYEKIAAIEDTRQLLDDETPSPTRPLLSRAFLVPILSFGQAFNKAELPEISVQILRDALGEFVFNRTPVSDYVRSRYPDLDHERRIVKQKEVFYRIQLAQDIAVEQMEISMYDPRLT